MGEVSIIELILRVFAATIVGALIGYEREIKNKPAGFYTFKCWNGNGNTGKIFYSIFTNYGILP